MERRHTGYPAIRKSRVSSQFQVISLKPTVGSESFQTVFSDHDLLYVVYQYDTTVHV